MKVGVVTSNQPRHLALLDALVMAGHTVIACVEPKSWVAGMGSDVFWKYWSAVRAAEDWVFGRRCYVRVPVFVCPMGEASEYLPTEITDADQVVVFGSSFLRGVVGERLVALGALNLHVGVAPEYRGSAPNAWAFYDGRPDLIGAQVQRLGSKLDAGEILAEVRTTDDDGEYFQRGMVAAKRGIMVLVDLLGRPRPWPSVRPNDPAQRIRFARYADWTEDIAAEILAKAGR